MKRWKSFFIFYNYYMYKNFTIRFIALDIMKLWFHSINNVVFTYQGKIFGMFDILLIAYGQSIYKHVRESCFTWLSNGQACRGMLRCIWLILEMVVFLLSYALLLCSHNSKVIKKYLNKIWLQWMTSLLS